MVDWDLGGGVGLGVGLSINGEEIFLMHQRAVFIACHQMLLIADLHLGKSDSLRMHGVANPAGSTLADLQRLEALLDTTKASHLIVLGDMIHGPSTGTEWKTRWSEFRNSRLDLKITLVMGNHDRKAHAASLDVEIVEEPYVYDDSLRFWHDLSLVPTVASPGSTFMNLGGHTHPVVKVAGIRKKFPAFVITENTILLPAFSEFTGGALVDRRSGRIVVCGPDGLLELPSVR